MDRKSFFHTQKNKIINHSPKFFSLYDEDSRIIFTLIFLLYLLTSIFVTRSSQSSERILFFGNQIPVQAFAGIYTSLANICIIFLVVFFRTPGFITSFILLLCQFPIIVFKMVLSHDLSIIPGLFTNILTIIAITIIYITNSRIEKYQKKMHEQALTDILTGLPNRIACTELIDEIVNRNHKFAIVSVDLNNFKSVNDTMGNEVGDKILCDIASRWKVFSQSFKSNTFDFVARLGGDEFALIIRNYNSDQDIINTINAYAAELERKFTIGSCDYFISACYGYAEFPTDADSSDSLFSCADAALHEIKSKNRSNHIIRYTATLPGMEKALEIERWIRETLVTDSVLFHLQPQFDTSHKLRGFEALARLKNPDGSFISPVEFIPVAEKAGLIDRIDLQILKKTAYFLKAILSEKETDIIISTNISVRHLMKNNFMEDIKKILKDTGVPAKHFELEITESILIDSDEKALQYLNEIKNLGIHVAIDDFGTGYSSLSYLHKFPADLLKIDKSFIDLMNTSESSKKYVEAIISMGHVLNLDVISEGVETSAQLEALKNAGCDFIQGFIWGRPLTPEEAEQLALTE